MLNKYVKINGERVPNPIDYSESFIKVSNEFQSEAGDDLAIDVRAGKYSGSLKFQLSSRWKNKLLGYAKMQSVKLQIDEAEYTVRVKSIDCDLEKNSEYSQNTQGYWTVSFSAEEL